MARSIAPKHQRGITNDICRAPSAENTLHLNGLQAYSIRRRTHSRQNLSKINSYQYTLPFIHTLRFNNFRHFTMHHYREKMFVLQFYFHVYHFIFNCRKSFLRFSQSIVQERIHFQCDVSGVSFLLLLNYTNYKVEFRQLMFNFY